MRELVVIAACFSPMVLVVVVGTCLESYKALTHTTTREMAVIDVVEHAHTRCTLYGEVTHRVGKTKPCDQHASTTQHVCHKVVLKDRAGYTRVCEGVGPFEASNVVGGDTVTLMTTPLSTWWNHHQCPPIMRTIK